MNKLAAAIKDKSAKTWTERKMWYKVGSCFKACLNCGDYEEGEDGRGRWTSGYEVFRSYRPWQTKWTWSCFSCGAKDLACWVDTYGELGKEPRVGCRSALAEIRKERREAMDPKPRVQRSVRVDELEREIARLRLLLVQGGK